MRPKRFACQFLRPGVLHNEEYNIREGKRQDTNLESLDPLRQAAR